MHFVSFGAINLGIVASLGAIVVPFFRTPEVAGNLVGSAATDIGFGLLALVLSLFGSWIAWRLRPDRKSELSTLGYMGVGAAMGSCS
jgi:hypothetical protein